MQSHSPKTKILPTLAGRLVAHRGYADQYPENTLEALRAAVKAGARFVEVDVQLSADGKPVLFHDPSLKRMCGLKGNVWDFNYKELLGFPAMEPKRFGRKFADVKIASLAGLRGFLRRHLHVTAFVEAKTESMRCFGIPRMLQAMLAELEPVSGQCVLISFSHPFLAYARKACPMPLGWVLTRWDQHKSRDARELKPEYLFCDRLLLPRFGSLPETRAQWCVYEITNPARARELLDRGVDLIETKNIGKTGE